MLQTTKYAGIATVIASYYLVNSVSDVTKLQHRTSVFTGCQTQLLSTVSYAVLAIFTHSDYQ